jgi:hypothetical protein
VSVNPRRFLVATVLLALGTLLAAHFVRRAAAGAVEIERDATTALAVGTLQARLLDPAWWERALPEVAAFAEFAVTAHPPGRGVWLDERRDGQRVARHAVLMEMAGGRTRVRWIRRKSEEGAHLPQGADEEARLERYLEALTGPSEAPPGNP